MTMRMLGVSGELTGPVLTIEAHRFVMDVDGEPFQAKVSCRPEVLEGLEVGQTVFVVGRIHFREFDEGHLLVDAQRLHTLSDAPEAPAATPEPEPSPLPEPFGAGEG